MAAYDEGEEWLDELRAYIYENYLIFKDFFEKELPDFPVLPLEGTYLAWVNCSILGIGSQEIEDRLIDENKVWVNAGVHYGPDGDSFVRVNLACPRSILLEGLDRLYKGFTAMKQESRA